MPKVTRLNDKSTSDECGAPPRKIITGSNNVLTNNRKRCRVTDQYKEHSCPDSSPHIGKACSGSRTVFINGKKSFRVGDKIDCGSNSNEGSDNVIAGG